MCGVCVCVSLSFSLSLGWGRRCVYVCILYIKYDIIGNLPLSLGIGFGKPSNKGNCATYKKKKFSNENKIKIMLKPLSSMFAGRIRGPYSPGCCQKYLAGVPGYWDGCKASAKYSKVHLHPWNKIRRALRGRSGLSLQRWQKSHSFDAQWDNGRTGVCTPQRGHIRQDCEGTVAAKIAHQTSLPI